MKAYRGSRGIAPFTSTRDGMYAPTASSTGNLSVCYCTVVQQYLLNRQPGGLQIRFDRFVEHKNWLHLRGFEPRLVQYSICTPGTVPSPKDSVSFVRCQC